MAKLERVHFFQLRDCLGEYDAAVNCGDWRFMLVAAGHLSQSCHMRV
jgi:hypothetical protein